MSGLQHFALQELYALDMPEPRWLVNGVLPAAALTLLAAREKAGKTLLANDLICSVALEEPWLGREVQAGTGLMLPAEEHLREVRHRLRQRLLGRDAPIFVAPINGQYGQRLRLSDPVSIDQLAETIRELSPYAVVIDPLREVHDGAENDSDEMAPLMRPLRQIAHELDVAIIVLHHMSKNGSARGSTAIAAAVDQIITFARTSEEEEGVRGRLDVNGRFGPRVSIAVELGDDLRWVVSQSHDIEPSNARERILWLLDRSDALTADQIKDQLGGLELRTVQNQISNMLKESTPPISYLGTGRKNDPRRYELVEPTAGDGDQNGSRLVDSLGDSIGGNHFGLLPNDSGSNGNHSGGKEEDRVCTDCAGPLEAHRQYRCDACVAASVARVNG